MKQIHPKWTDTSIEDAILSGKADWRFRIEPTDLVLQYNGEEQQYQGAFVLAKKELGREFFEDDWTCLGTVKDFDKPGVTW